MIFLLSELVSLVGERRSRLEESRRLWQFYWEMAEEEGWIKEKEQLMTSPGDKMDPEIAER